MSQFYNDMAASVLRADYTIYLILAYLTLFRLEELTFPQYRKFIESQEPDKMNVFLAYVFDVSHLADTVKWDWLKIYDLEHVENAMIRPISEHAGEAEGFRMDILAAASGLESERNAPGSDEGAVSKRHLTIPVSPRLTKPAPRAVPAPDKIAQEVVAGKEPRYLERTSVEQIESEKAARRALEFEKTTKKYTESSIQPFAFHETRSVARVSRRDAEQKNAAQLLFETKSTQARAAPKAATKAEFRMNTAAYMREDSLYKRKQEDEVKLIEAYESELRDSTEYYRWQSEMRERDKQGRLEQVERVRTLAKLSAEEAQQAMDKQRRNNAEIASRIKAESAEMQKQLSLESEMHRQMNQQLVKEVIQVREHAPKEAQYKMLEQRKERHGAIREDMKAKLAEREAEAKTEQEERLERAKQLKALREVRPTRVNVFDPTESIGVGLLDEMSLVELKERLAVNRVHEEERELQLRHDIILSRQKKELNLRKRIENVERVRAAAMSSNKDAREKQRTKEAAEEEAAQKARNAANMGALEVQEARRTAMLAERRSLQDEEARRLKEQAFGGHGAHAAEEKHFADLLKGIEREAVVRQGEAQRATQVYEKTKLDMSKAAQVDMRRRRVQNERADADAADELHRKQIALAQKQKEEISEKKALFLNQREKHRLIKEKIISMNPYAQAQTESSRSKREVRREKQLGDCH